MPTTITGWNEEFTNNAACTVFVNLINLAVRMMPILVCLESEHRDRESIAVISVCLWAIIISVESILRINPQVFFVFRGIFSCLYFLVFLISFKGALLKKGFLCTPAWPFAVLSTSLNEFASWVLKEHVPLTYGQICVAVSLLQTCGFYVFVWFWLGNRVSCLFDQLPRQSRSPLLTYPSVSLFILFVGNDTISSPRPLAACGLEDILLYLVLYVMILALYVLILSNILEIMCHRRAEEELQFTRQLISQQREHYNQTLDYTERVHITKHDFHHHIHALLNTDRGERTHYLMNLKRELDMTAEMVFCQNQTVDGPSQEYTARARQDGVGFTARVDLSAHVSVDDLTLRIIIGNLLGDATEAYRRLTGHRFILIRTRWLDGHLMMPVENSYNGQAKKNRGKILSSKRDGGLGILSIKRILSQLGGEFDMDYNDTIFTAMVEIVDRALGQTDGREVLERFRRDSCQRDYILPGTIYNGSCR